MVVVLFVALTDMDPRMGPTQFLPRSHTRAFHRRREALRASGTHDLPSPDVSDGAAPPSARAASPGGRHAAGGAARAAGAFCTPMLRRGDAVLMDAACIHAGGANSLRPRTLFHLSFSRARYQLKGFAGYAQSLDAGASKGIFSGALASLG